jgi:hypothetical protein
MKPMRLLVGVVVAAGVVLASSPAQAQDPAPRGGARDAGANAQILTPIELERWFDSYVLLQAQDTLRLTDAQFARALPPLKALQAARRRHQQSRRPIVGAIGALLKATPPDEAMLREKLKTLRDLEVRSAEDVRRAYDALDEVLDPTQQARFRLFEEQVERRKFDLLMKARQRAGEPAGPNRSR